MNNHPNTFAGFDLDKLYKEDQERIREEAEQAKIDRQRQALKDRLAAKKKSGKKVPLLKKPKPVPSSRPLQPGNITYGRFGVQDIKRVPLGYEFTGLELPIGTYSSLLLGKDLLLNETKQDFTAWTTFNSDLSQVKDAGGFRVMPSWIRYALMSVCYQKKDDHSLKSIIEEIRQNIWIPDSNTNYPYDATKVQYHSKQRAIVTHGAGWPLNDPLYRVITKAAVAGENKQITAKSKSVISALESLVYDSNPAGVRDTLLWAMNPNNKQAYLWRCDRDSEAERVVVFGVSYDIANIDANSNVNDHGPARGVSADAKNFHRK